MIEPNVLNYFTIVLGGFALVWSFKGVAGRRAVPLGEFEYAAFSTIWGVGVFYIFLFLTKGHPESLAYIQVAPMTGTPALVLLGMGLGSVGGLGFQELIHYVPYVQASVSRHFRKLLNIG